jgi:uncharacterized protein (TIGR02466 family)
MAKVKKQTCAAAKSVEEVIQQSQLQLAHHFPSQIYLIERPDFLESVMQVSEGELEIARKNGIDELHPVLMTNNFFGDPRVHKFSEFVGTTAWNILSSQGYAMADKSVQFTEMWTQEHHKHSLMEQHIHGYGSQMVGFYFLEAPENSSRLVFHDPRAGKVQSELQEQDTTIATAASKMINFTPKAGLLVFANSWLAHSFTKHAADSPLKFVHFNLTVIQTPQSFAPPPAEVV